MNGAAFPSPAADMAEMNRIHYELEYTEGISQRMRIPEQLKVAPYETEDQELPEHETHHTAMMHVPERIMVMGTRWEDLCLHFTVGYSAVMTYFCRPGLGCVSQKHHNHKLIITPLVTTSSMVNLGLRCFWKLSPGTTYMTFEI